MELEAGQIWWMRPDPTVGREQSGRRPAVVVSGETYNSAVDTLALVVPLTTRDRRWPNHVRVCTKGEVDLLESWIMTEQVKVVSRNRFDGLIGEITHDCLAEVRTWLMRHLED